MILSLPLTPQNEWPPTNFRKIEGGGTKISALLPIVATKRESKSPPPLPKTGREPRRKRKRKKDLTHLSPKEKVLVSNE